jgi:hypothetical protein
MHTSTSTSICQASTAATSAEIGAKHSCCLFSRHCCFCCLAATISYYHHPCPTPHLVPEWLVVPATALLLLSAHWP